MKTIFRTSIVLFVALVCAVTWSVNAQIRGGGGGGRGGGARPSMGNVGGGGGRPSMGGGSRPSASRPAASHPSPNRPSMGNVSRPANVSRPSGGGFSPSGGGRPDVTRPTARPTTLPGGSAMASRPSVRPPNQVKPASRPSLPSGGIAGANRPNLGNLNRPSTLPGNIGNRPGGDRPNVGNLNRPATLPGNIGNSPGGGGDRPSLGNLSRPTTLPGNIGNLPVGGGDRPSLGNLNRPTTLPGNTGNRPGIGGNRPGIGGNRPDLPGIGNGNGIANRPGTGNRPGIGNGIGNRPGIGTGNINIGNDINIGSGNVGIGNIGNRPGWDRPNNWNRPGGGWGYGGGGWGYGGGWGGNWHDHCINPHHGWYNGCHSDNWGSNWYAPVAWASVGWGLGAMTSGWGYGTSYYNPYYVQPVVTTTIPYDYSQPVVVNNYVSSDAESGDAIAQAEQESPASDQAMKLFDDGLSQFKSGDYQAALGNFDAALLKLPGDPVVHEVRALTLFALGNYQSSAAALNSFLSSAPPMDWTTMSSLYGNVDEYQSQLRKLEQHCQSNANDPAAHFVLAYQYLAIGSKDEAVKALKVVVKNQPKDSTAKRMLDALVPPEATPTPVPSSSATPADTDAPQTDLVGNWRATAGETTIDLAITEDSQFTWKATPKGQPGVELKGELASSSEELVLETKEQGAMAGSVKSLGPDSWQFVLSGAPPADPGLSFARVKN